MQEPNTKDSQISVTIQSMVISLKSFWMGIWSLCLTVSGGLASSFFYAKKVRSGSANMLCNLCNHFVISEVGLPVDVWPQALDEYCPNISIAKLKLGHI